ncbi:MAG: hypothetical protein IJI68_14240 [Eggerthellaceae bacterium]|nr:hypothetical protein [Eggerthellaceae bacterium]
MNRPWLVGTRHTSAYTSSLATLFLALRGALGAADRAFDEARATMLAQADFERFCEQLEHTMPDAARRLLESDPEWA